MKKISKELYRDKVYGCWLGKNIGGTLGAPFEAKREAVDVEFYTHDLSQGALPNDDLDLQLAWLCAAEKFGISVDAKILAEYWVSVIVPNWAEYGVGKTNLRLGLEPPVSGGACNAFKDSNGAWIRSEIWACLMPGHPELAVRYAYQDAIVVNGNRSTFTVTHSGYNGRLIIDTLLPKKDDLQIGVVNDDTHFEVFGIDYPATLKENGCNEGGACRIQVSAKKAQKENFFLNVLQISDAKSDVRPLDMELIETNEFWGAAVAERIVLFAKTKKRIDRDFSFELEKYKNFENAKSFDVQCSILICGVAEGKWEIDGTLVTVSKEGGILAFEGCIKPGVYKVKRI